MKFPLYRPLSSYNCNHRVYDFFDRVWHQWLMCGNVLVWIVMLALVFAVIRVMPYSHSLCGL